MKLLAIDTATELSSAALWLDGPSAAREARRGQGHAELILPMIDELLKAAAVSLSDLDAIAFGRGPGAFTGVRLAVSLAQGLGWSAHLPLIPVSNLRAVAARVPAQSQTPVRVLVCMDARMHEVYWGCFERCGDAVVAAGPEGVAPPAAVSLPAAWEAGAVCGVGTGFGAYGEELQRRLPGLNPIDPVSLPRAAEIAALAAAGGLDAAIDPEEAQPVYLRDDVAKVPSASASSGRQSSN